MLHKMIPNRIEEQYPSFFTFKIFSVSCCLKQNQEQNIMKKNYALRKNKIYTLLNNY
jgi:hypothetical protein